MNAFEQQWHEALMQRKQSGRLRQLKPRTAGIDFCSNDYLGMARSERFADALLEAAERFPGLLCGATGSRLISGNAQLTEQTESVIAAAHQVDAALLFPSGYKANLALFSCMAGRHDTILTDEWVHRSVHDGCRLSDATKWKFRHNDMNHLEALLKRAKGKKVIAVESLYSMNGDFAPLHTIVALAAQYGAGVVVDEAHAMGVFGLGLVHVTNLQRSVTATVVTYGKAMGTQGAAVLGSTLLKNYLVNFASPFIYSTAMPGIQVISIRTAYDLLQKNPQPQADLQDRIRQFRAWNLSVLSQDGSPIQAIRFSSEAELRRAAQALQQSGFLVYPVFAPAVTAGGERLRICLHAYNSTADIYRLCALIKQYDVR